MNTTVKTKISPAEALLRLKEGNFRFVNNMPVNRDLLYRVYETRNGQEPFAAIVSCMDSRTPAELIMDQGVGDIFNIRIAGNIITDGILGSLEFATAVAGSSLILVLGHTNCGAIKGACNNVKMGHLTGLLDQIQPSVAAVQKNGYANDTELIDEVTRLNVIHSASQIVERSSIIRELIEKGDVAIAWAIYNVKTGKVCFAD